MLGSLRLVTVWLCLICCALAQNAPGATATVSDLQKFLKDADARLKESSVKCNQAGWVQETYITDDTEALAAAMNEGCLQVVSELAAQTKRFDGLQAPPDLARQLKLLKLLVAAPAP